MIGANTEIIDMEMVSKRIITKGTVYCSFLLDFAFRSYTWGGSDEVKTATPRRRSHRGNNLIEKTLTVLPCAMVKLLVILSYVLEPSSKTHYHHCILVRNKSPEIPQRLIKITFGLKSL